MVRFTFKGMMAPNFTPFKENGSLNLEIIKAYAKHLGDSGVKGLWVSGTSGEGLSMTLEERKAVTEAWLGCRDDVPCAIIQCGAGCLKDTQELARHAAQHGASGVAVLPCLYDKPTSTDDLVDYMLEVAKACPDTPLFYYHIPFKTGVNLSMSEFLQKGMKRIPNLSGLKFTDHDVSGEGKKCVQVAADGGMAIFSGFDQRLQEALSVGFTCAVNACYNFVPDLGARIFTLMEEGKTEEAKAAQEVLTGHFDTIAEQVGAVNVSSLKTTCTLLTGLDMGPTRFPVRPLTPAATASLRDAFRSRGLTVY